MIIVMVCALLTPQRMSQALQSATISEVVLCEERVSGFAIVDVLPVFTYVSADFTPRVRPPANSALERYSPIEGWTSGFT